MRGCVRLDAAARGRLSVAKPRRGFHFRGIPTTCDPFDLQRVREGIAFLPWEGFITVWTRRQNRELRAPSSSSFALHESSWQDAAKSRFSQWAMNWHEVSTSLLRDTNEFMCLSG